MKKIIIILLSLLAFTSYGQAEFEKVAIKENVETASTTKIVSQQPGTGELNYINATALPVSTPTQNALDMKLNISDLPTNLTLYPTTAASDIPGYTKMVTSINDPEYNTVAVDVSTPTITTTAQLVSQRVSAPGVLVGQPGVFNITTFGNIKRLSGTGTANFYFEVYHRDLAGTETLICTSSVSDVVSLSTYSEFTASGIWDDGDFLPTDRIVIKTYANRIPGNSDPVYQIQYGGVSPVRTLLPVPFSVVDAGYELKANKQNSLAIDGTGTKYPTVDAVNALKWIKSNESLSLAQRKGDVLYGILDQYTGEEMTLSKITGTPIVDNIIYFQLGGEYFKRNYTQIRPEWWGAIADGTTDSTIAIQAAINFAYYKDSGVEVLLPAGIIRITNTLHLGYGVSGFGSISLIGHGSKFRSEEAFKGTAIICDFSDRPAINIQGNILTKMQGFSLKGKLFEWINNHHLGENTTIPTIDDTVSSNWNDPSLSPTQDDRYRPYAGIAIDAYAGEDTGTSYPTVDYSYLGTGIPQFNKNRSQNIQIEDLFIEGFNTGFVTHPNGSDGNGDFPKLLNVRFEKCKYAVSISQPQCRQVSLINCYVFQFYTGITNRVHGLQQGNINSSMVNLGMELGINMFNIDTTRSGTLSFDNLFGEAIWSFGNFSDPAKQGSPIVFNNAQIAFSNLKIPSSTLSIAYQRKVPAYIMNGDASSIKFIGGNLNDFELFANFQPEVSFEGTKIINDTGLLNTTIPTYLGNALNATMGGVVTNQLNLSKQNLIFHLTNLDSGYYNSNLVKDREYNINQRINCIPLYAKLQQHVNDTNGNVYNRPNISRFIDKSGMTISTTGVEVTITDTQFDQGDCVNFGGAIGDVVIDSETGTILIVISKSTNTVTMEAQTNWYYVGATKTLIVPITSTGNFKTANCRLYMLQFPHTGNYSTSGNAITGLKTSNDITAITPIQVGDVIWNDEQRLRTYGLNGGVVTGINNSTQTVSTNQNALFNGTFPVIFYIRVN